jgi:hypothetical protein
MNEAVRAAAQERGVSRLCHFTPSRNLAYIAKGRLGILSTKKLEESERKVFNPTDLLRLDGHKSHISCSVEYPNAWYFSKAAEKDRLFTDWVVLAIAPNYLWDDETLFCPYNAAKGYGAGVRPDLAGFERMFAESVMSYSRTALRAQCCPTDEQAEVLVKDVIQLSHVHAVIVHSAEQAKREAVRLEMLGVNPGAFQWRVGPVLFQKWELHKYLEAGRRPAEEIWTL